MAERERDRWDKAEILLRPAGALLTALTVALVGFLTTSFLEQRQITEAKTRLYAELMSKREEADSTLRKDMFNSIIQSFLKSESDEEIKQQVLNLELLAYNFHDALDLGPLFKHLRREIQDTTALADGDDPSTYLERLETVSKEVIQKQVAALEESGGRIDGLFIDLATLKQHPEGVKVIDETVADRQFTLEILDVNGARREALVRLRVLKQAKEGLETEVDSLFHVGFFDFPMIDNTRLSSGKRCAVVLDILDPVVKVTLVHFPASRAGLKEKPYYEEIIEELRLESDEASRTGA